MRGSLPAACATTCLETSSRNARQFSGRGDKPRVDSSKSVPPATAESAVCQASDGAQVASPQNPIVRCNKDTLCDGHLEAQAKHQSRPYYSNFDRTELSSFDRTTTPRFGASGIASRWKRRLDYIKTPDRRHDPKCFVPFGRRLPSCGGARVSQYEAKRPPEVFRRPRG